jgi:small subunit ribosomal protein S2
MKPYIFGQRNGLYIIDLQKRLKLYEDALKFAREVGTRGGKILFVGTKPQAQEVIKEQALRVGMPYVVKRWLGGMLTNFPTIRKTVERLEHIEQMESEGRLELHTKKEAAKLRKEREKLIFYLGGIRSMTGLPEALFVVDTKKEAIAIHEANILGIPVIGLVDTNGDPDFVDYMIPANDDAIKSVRFFSSGIVDSLLEGLRLAKDMGIRLDLRQEQEEGQLEPLDTMETTQSGEGLGEA